MHTQTATPLIDTSDFKDLVCELSETVAAVDDGAALPFSRDQLDELIAKYGIQRPKEGEQSARSRVLTALHRVAPRAGMMTTDALGNTVERYPDAPHDVPFRLVVVNAPRGEYALHRIVSYSNYMPTKTSSEQDKALARYQREIRDLRSNANVDAETKAKLIGHEAALKMLDRQQKAAHDALRVAMETGADAVAALARDYAAQAAQAEVEAEMARERRLIGNG